MTQSPILSIVTPTRGNFSEHWLQQLLAIQGAVEFILVYPPDATLLESREPRLKAIRSPYKGELIQRATGLLNASGQYLLALDDDDFLHPNVEALILDYFDQYPQSWCLRLAKKRILQADQAAIQREWDALPQVKDLTVAARRQADHAACQVLQTLPIAPLENPFQLKAIWPNTGRTDHQGPHIENFNNIVWQRSLVQPAVADLLRGAQWGALTWMPFWSLDRLLGLFVQARLFQADQVVGHWLHDAEQVRYIISPLKEVRTMFWGDLLLALRFPQYGYFWNLFWDQLWTGLKIMLQDRLRRPQVRAAHPVPSSATSSATSPATSSVNS